MGFMHRQTLINDKLMMKLLLSKHVPTTETEYLSESSPQQLTFTDQFPISAQELTSYMPSASLSHLKLCESLLQ